MKSGLIANVRKIAVLRANGLGDLMFALPALQALHETYADAEIVYLGTEWHAEFLQDRLPSVDRAVAIPQTEGVLVEAGKEMDPRAQAEFFNQMQAEKFDLVFQMHGGGAYSNPFVVAMHPRITIGARAQGSPQLDRWIPYIFYQSEIMRNLEIAGLAGASTADYESHLPVLARDLQAAEPILEQLQRPFIVIHPGATDARRRWDPANYAQVADELACQHGLTVALTGTAPEKHLIQVIKEHMQQPAVDLCGQLSLEGMVGLLSQAELILANNTGPLHLAHAIGRKVVGLFFVESIINALPLNRQNFYPLIAWDRRCPVCGKYCDKAELDNKHAAPCKHRTSFLNEIRPEMAIRAVNSLLNS